MTPIKKTAGNFKLPPPLQRIVDARHHDPFEVLGRHQEGDTVHVRVYRPGATGVTLPDQGLTLTRLGGSDFFEWQGAANRVPPHYRVCWEFADGSRHTAHDPYCFPPMVGDLDMHLFSEGRHLHVYRVLGAHPVEHEGVAGVLFAVWAPNAQRVSIIGNHNGWDGRIHPMRNRGGNGIWELFIPELPAGSLYKFELRSPAGDVLVKGDPYGAQWQKRPDTAAVVAAAAQHEWADDDWLVARQGHDWQHKPMAIYEVHLGSWRRQGEEFLDYRELAVQLTDYVTEHGFTHVELLPITEHPLDASWGYQCTGFFAPTSRFGDPDDFRYFVDYLHRHGIGVILDWVPGHFPRDAHGLARFDGTALYEYEDPRKGEHRDWGTLIFNYGRHEVKCFLLASAVHWIEEFHLDGLRVDAVASMLYLDYSREAGDWEPNIYGGREHLEAVDFLRELNTVLHERFPGILMIAEESTAWPQVSRPVYLGGLGFGMKWNMGWMHDTLAYMSKDPIHRHYHHDLLTFGLLYNFTENFVLPFSHDEVVHGKGSMIGKMHGDEWQRFANLRLLYTFQWTYPGKKLLFMGGEFAQGSEWSEARQLEWQLLEYGNHQGIARLIKDLNRLYRDEQALHQLDFEAMGFDWIDCHDSSQSTLSYLRRDAEGNDIAVVLNFTPVPRHDYRIGLPATGEWEELLCSDSSLYGGSNLGNGGRVFAEDQPWMNRPASARLVLPPLAAVVLRRRG